MTIQDLKTHINILDLAAHIGINIDPKTKKTNCPFHNDKTPSLQFSQEKQIATCFSSNCNAGTMDVISLTAKFFDFTTAEAITYLKDQFLAQLIETQEKQKKKTMETPDYAADFEQMQSSFLSSINARKYAETRHLDWQNLEVGYNAFKGGKFKYTRGCITFGLRNSAGKTVSIYGRSIRDNDKARHYYTASRKGLYPKYPGAETKTLILTESIIDAATLLSIPAITKNHEILALYGTNGFTAEHLNAIQRLEKLTEIILFFDGDEAGKAANEKHGKYLSDMFPNLKISVVNTPDEEDINSLADGHKKEIFTTLINERQPFLFSRHNAEFTNAQNVQRSSFSVENKKPAEPLTPKLNTENPNNITYQTDTANYYIKGALRMELDSLKVTLVIEHPEDKAKSRNKLDLYEDKQTTRVAREASEKLAIRADLVEQDLNILTDLLDEYREATMFADDEKKPEKIEVLPAQRERCITFMKKPKLIERFNEMIGNSGVVGEEGNRIFLLVIASTYKMLDTLHALIQGSSGSGKTHLLGTIMSFMPPEDAISLTRITESSLYNYGKNDLSHKLIGIEDFDGLEEKAELAFRELQSKGVLASSTSGKNEETGKIKGFVKEVFGPIASLSATTRGEIYEDNMSRSFLVAVDESKEQTLRIIKHQNKRAAGGIDETKEKENRNFLRDCMRLLEPLKVKNPFADKIDLPREAHKIRRLNDLFQCFVKQITLLNQYQRKKDENGYLITEKDDVKTAIEIMFDSIILKVDELDGSLRDFYERLKRYVVKHGGNNPKGYEFSQREIRQDFLMSKTQIQRHFGQLIELEYVTRTYVGIRNTYHYKIAYWDNMEALRARIKNDLNNQLTAL